MDNGSQSEPLDSDFFEKPTHRKSVSFDLSGDEPSKSDHERSRTPDSSSEHEFTSRKLPRKGILRAASPSSSVSSTTERRHAAEKPLPIVPTVARIKEIDSPIYQRSPSPSGYRSRSRSPPPPPIVEQVPETEEIERENPFRDAFLHKNRTDDYTEMAKVISKSPNLLKSARQQFFNESPPAPVVEKLPTSPTGARPKVKPPPPPKPKNIKKADIVRNLALETFQKTEMGQADFEVYEHDPEQNIIHEISSSTTSSTTSAISPKLPVRVLTRSISRPTESPPLPPVNYVTMPKLPTTPTPCDVEYLEVLPPLPASIKHTESHHENATDKILVTEQEHRQLLLRENDLRNQLQKNLHSNEDLGVPESIAPPVPQRASSKHLVNEFSSSNDTLDSITNNNNSQQSTNYMNNSREFLHNNFSFLINTSTNQNPTNSSIITTNMQPQMDAVATNTAAPPTPLLATQLFPTAQILPVQYTQLPQPQQPFSLGSYVLVPQTQFTLQTNPNAATATPIFISNQAGAQQFFQLQPTQAVSVTSPTPSYTTMQFPSLSEINTPNAYENSSAVTSSKFSIDSSFSSLTKTTQANSYYETAEEIYSIIQEDAIYSNTAFFDSRRNSDTSLDRSSLTLQPPPLPPKKPGTFKTELKFISKSQPHLEIPLEQSRPIGKETTV